MEMKKRRRTPSRTNPLGLRVVGRKKTLHKVGKMREKKSSLGPLSLTTTRRSITRLKTRRLLIRKRSPSPFLKDNDRHLGSPFGKSRLLPWRLLDRTAAHLIRLRNLLEALSSSGSNRQVKGLLNYHLS